MVINLQYSMGKEDLPFYEETALAEMYAWLKKVKKKPGILSLLTTGTQQTINAVIPEKVHQAITFAVEKMVKGVLFGNKYLTTKPLKEGSLQLREEKVRRIIKFYQTTASVEGAVTGAGGILLGLADFPVFLSIKLKMLFEIASAYGQEVRNFKERLFLLYVFQLAFSSQESQNQTIKILEQWDDYAKQLPEDLEAFDWRHFQLEYRDFMDLAKLAQLIPVVGAGVGAIANYRLSSRLGDTAMQCFRMRYFAGQF